MSTSYRQQKRKYNRKILILICLLFISLLPFITTFSRYAINSLNEYYSRTKEFYFNSDKLDVYTPEFLIDNWSGVEPYPIQVKVNSMKNNILGASYNIDYEIEAECTTHNAVYTLSQTSGTISKNTHEDSFTLNVIPNANLEIGDEVNVVITAYTTEPYERTLSGSFTLRVGRESITYVIEDSANSPYCELKVTNTQSFYIKDPEYADAPIANRVTIDEYLALSPENQAKYHSALITLTFNPAVVRLDMTNENYLNAISVDDTTLNGYTYINELKFKVDAISSTTVRFYKVETSRDYTYPNNSNNSVITFVAQ